MEPSLAAQLAKFVVQTSYPEIPKEVVDFTKGLVQKRLPGPWLDRRHLPDGRLPPSSNHEI